jgi:uncharacterized protein YeaO (DUF488 family)
LDEDCFSTVRPHGKFEENDDVMIVRPEHDSRQGKVMYVWPRVLDEIPAEFLAHDTDTASKDDAIAVLRGFYPDLNVKDIWDIVRVKYTGPPDQASIANNIRLECYRAILARVQQEHPDAHFEIITRQEMSSPLSPSWPLLKQAKAEAMPFEEYGEKLLEEIRHRKDAFVLMKKLYELAKHQPVYLVCYEKDYSKCHRSLVKRWIMEYGGASN